MHLSIDPLPDDALAAGADTTMSHADLNHKSRQILAALSCPP